MEGFVVLEIVLKHAVGRKRLVKRAGMARPPRHQPHRNTNPVRLANKMLRGPGAFETVGPILAAHLVGLLARVLRG